LRPTTASNRRVYIGHVSRTSSSIFMVASSETTIDFQHLELVTKDAYSGFKAAYPMPLKKADYIADAIDHL
jgi:hypothetical protein